MQLREYAAFAHGRLWACKPTVSRHPYFTPLSALRGLLCRGRWCWVTHQIEPLAQRYTQRQMRIKQRPGESRVIAARLLMGLVRTKKNPRSCSGSRVLQDIHTYHSVIDQVPGEARGRQQ